MRGITIIFNNDWIHTGNDLDLVQEVKKIGKPTIQSYKVQVPGRNGLLNLTKALSGKVNYDNRQLSFQYFGSGDRETLLSLENKMLIYHGETVKIIDDDYPDHYYEGEVSVETELHSTYITIKMTVDAQPFRLKLKPTTLSRNVTNSAIIRLDNESIPVIPDIMVSDTMTIIKGEVSHSLEAGTYRVSDFELSRGVNTFEIIGSGVITFKYQEGAI